MALHQCRGCERRTTALYCCHACSLAHEGKYEIHESGILGHSDGCNERHAERSKPEAFEGPDWHVVGP